MKINTGYDRLPVVGLFSSRYGKTSEGEIDLLHLQLIGNIAAIPEGLMVSGFMRSITELLSY
jgi:hypothetical protein